MATPSTVTISPINVRAVPMGMIPPSTRVRTGAPNASSGQSPACTLYSRAISVAYVSGVSTVTRRETTSPPAISASVHCTTPPEAEGSPRTSPPSEALTMVRLRGTVNATTTSWVVSPVWLVTSNS